MRVFVWRAEKMKGYLLLGVFGMMMSFGLAHTYKEEMAAINTMLPTEKKVIILDAGHGGWAPCI